MPAAQAPLPPLRPRTAVTMATHHRMQIPAAGEAADWPERLSVTATEAPPPARRALRGERAPLGFGAKLVFSCRGMRLWRTPGRLSTGQCSVGSVSGLHACGGTTLSIPFASWLGEKGRMASL